MIHESKDGLAGNGCADSRTQAAQHMGLHQAALAALPVVPAASTAVSDEAVFAFMNHSPPF